MVTFQIDSYVFFCSRSFYQILYKLYTIYSSLFVFITDYKWNLSKKTLRYILWRCMTFDTVATQINWFFISALGTTLTSVIVVERGVEGWWGEMKGEWGCVCMYDWRNWSATRRNPSFGPINNCSLFECKKTQAVDGPLPRHTPATHPAVPVYLRTFIRPSMCSASARQANTLYNVRRLHIQ